MHSKYRSHGDVENVRRCSCNGINFYIYSCRKWLNICWRWNNWTSILKLIFIIYRRNYKQTIITSRRISTINASNTNRAINTQIMWIRCNYGNACRRCYWITSKYARNTNSSTKRSNNSTFLNSRLEIGICWIIINYPIRSRSIGFGQFMVIHLKVGQTFTLHYVNAISILKYRQFMVTKIWGICIWFGVFINWTRTIKNTKLPKITPTSHSEDSRIINIRIFRVWNIFWSNLSFSKIHSNYGSSSWNNQSTMNTIILVKFIGRIIQIKDTDPIKLRKTSNYTINILYSSRIINWIPWTIINYMFSRIEHDCSLIKLIIIKSNLIRKSSSF